MATLSASRAGTTFPVNGGGGDGKLHFAYGVYEVASAMSKSDIVEFCKIPPKAVVLKGFLWGDDLDTGVETFDFDIGYTGSTAAFLNSAVITGDVVADVRPVASIYYPFNMKDGPVTPSATAETTVQGLVNAVCAGGGTGTLYCGVYFYVP